MPNHLTLLGIFHTVISVIALLSAFYALFRDGKINPLSGPGKLYVLLTVITCLSGLPIMKTGHPTPGHFLAIIILVLLPIGIYIKSIRIFGKLSDYVQTIIMSSTLFFSMVPAIVETLTRLPISGPLAAGPNAAIIQMGLLILVTLYLTGTIYQLFKIKAGRKITQTPNANITLT